MRRALLALVALTVCGSAIPQTRRVEYGGAVRVYVDNQLLRFDTAPIHAGNGRLLVPMRRIFESLGATVVYRKDGQRITARRGDTEVVMQVGKGIANVNGENRLMDAAPIISRGRVLVPLRFIAETLDSTTAYYPNERLVRITSHTGER